MLLETFSTSSAHDLWVEARQLSLVVTRPTGTTLAITVTRPPALKVVDGAVLVLSTTPLTPNGYPADGVQYTSNAAFGSTVASKIDTAQVVGFFSGIQGLPFPASTANPDGTVSFTVTITGTQANQLYYASLHGASSVLQYFPLGVQAYPVDSSSIDKESSSYAGSIPTLPSAPTDPTPGMVYFDQQLRAVQYWDTSNSVWVPTRTDQILSGEYNPGTPGQTYLFGGNALKIFAAGKWNTGTSSNLQLAAGSAWIPFTAAQSLTDLPATPAAGLVVYSYTTRRVQYFDGTAWKTPTASTVLFNTGSTIIPAFTTQFEINGEQVITPYVGLLFYNTSTKLLNVYNGTAWGRANTAQQGTATADKVGIGSDGTYDQRVRLINVLKAQLGYPSLCIELSEEQFNVAVDNALDTYRQLSIGAYEQRYIAYTLLKDQSIYFLNSPADRTDAVVVVNKIHRMNVLGVSGSGPDNVWGQAFAQSFYNSVSGGGDMVSAQLVANWSEDFTRMFAGDIPFLWNEARRELFLKRSVRQSERVVLEVELERSEQELMVDRYCKQFIQNWALAECKEYIGMIRAKFSSGTPGPAGTITLNGDTMLAEARSDFAELKEALLAYEYQNSEHGNISWLQA